MSAKIPRRCDTLRLVEAEKAIAAAVQVIENMTGDPRLTDAVVFLSQAQECVADFIHDRPRHDWPQFRDQATPVYIWSETLRCIDNEKHARELAVDMAMKSGRIRLYRGHLIAEYERTVTCKEAAP